MLSLSRKYPFASFKKLKITINRCCLRHNSKSRMATKLPLVSQLRNRHRFSLMELVVGGKQVTRYQLHHRLRSLFLIHKTCTNKTRKPRTCEKQMLASKIKNKYMLHYLPQMSKLCINLH